MTASQTVPSPCSWTANPASRCVSARFVSPDHLTKGAKAAWEDLSERASEPNIFAEAWCLLPGIAAFGDGQDVRLLWVEDEAGLVGVMPVEIGALYGRLPVRHFRNWAHHNVFLGTPLVRAGAEGSFWQSVIDHLNAEPESVNFLHLDGLVEGGPMHLALQQVVAAAGDPLAIVHQVERALLQSDLSPEDYYAATVRKKKRKELNQLANRFQELGEVEYRRFGERPDDDLNDWRDVFFMLEAKGWKGAAGSALGSDDTTRQFFSDLIAGAQERGRLDFLRLDLDGQTVAMLVNFLSPPGSFSFKIAFDEDYARFSPGVMIERYNYDILNRPDIYWMDSCASADHPMINSLWGQRRNIIRVTTPLKGPKRRMVHDLVRAGEEMMAAYRRWQMRGQDCAADLTATEDDDK